MLITVKFSINSDILRYCKQFINAQNTRLFLVLQIKSE